MSSITVSDRKESIALVASSFVCLFSLSWNTWMTTGL